MVKFKVSLKDLLGKAYYQYQLSMSSTNVTTGNDVTATVTVKNILGNPVSNKELELFYKGTSQGTQTTNELGMATWTITTSDLGLAKITIGGTNTYNYINITDGWKTYTPQINSYTTFYYNDDTRTAEFHYYRTNYTFTGTSAVTLHSGAIPSAYRPKSNIILASYNTTIVGAVNTDGDILSATSTTGTKNININGMWHY